MRLYEQGLAKLHEGKYEPAGVERSARYSLVENAAEEVKKLVRDKNYDKEVFLSNNTPADPCGAKRR